jgi:hypothetical protein
VSGYVARCEGELATWAVIIMIVMPRLIASQDFTLPVFSGTLAALHFTTPGFCRGCRNKRS